VYAEKCVVAGTASTIAMLKGHDKGVQWPEELGLPHICMNQEQEIVWHLKTSREFEIIILLNGLCVHGSANMHASDAT